MGNASRFRKSIFDASMKQLDTIGEYGFRFFRNTHSLGTFNDVRHWHDWIEFELILKGEEEKEVNGHAFKVQAGQGVFINSGRMHSQKRIGDGEFELFTMLCEPQLLSGQEKGLFYRKYMQRLLRSEKFDYILLDNKEEWQKKAIELIRNISQLDDRDKWYEYNVRRILEELWMELLIGTEIEIADMEPLPEDEGSRMDAAMEYIYAHYKEHITLEDIANAAEVSRGECCRMFRKALQTSPINMLNKYRIEKATELLGQNGKNVGEVSKMVGFQSMSAFTAAFKKHMQYSPSEFRRIQDESGPLANGGGRHPEKDV